VLAFVVRRLLWGAFIVFGVITITFFAVEAVPGDPFSGIQSPKMTPEAIEAYKASRGYGKGSTALSRYRDYLGALFLRGDLGKSIAQNRPVTDMLADAIPNTLKLTLAALFLDMALGILFGVISALRQHSRLDNAITLGSLFLYSMPGFWLSLMLALVFAVKLGWFPRHGIHSPGGGGFLDYLHHLAMPSVALGVAAAASTARFQRSALLEVIRQDYIRTARAKGLPERTVIWKHAMRNALLPTITLLGLYLPFLFSGAIITESIFAWPGMGSMTIEAIHNRDVEVVSAVTIVGTTMVLAGSLLADALYAVADPRVRLS
jgi:peptide/nickel transport system permease protein